MQWLKCKKEVGERSPPIFSPPLSFPPLLSSAAKQSLKTSAVSFPSGVRVEAPAANAFRCILSSKIAPDVNIFGYFILA